MEGENPTLGMLLCFGVWGCSVQPRGDGALKGSSACWGDTGDTGPGAVHSGSARSCPGTAPAVRKNRSFPVCVPAGLSWVPVPAQMCSSLGRCWGNEMV